MFNLNQNTFLVSNKIIKVLLILIVIFSMVFPYFVLPVVVGNGATYSWSFILINLFLLFFIIRFPLRFLYKIKEVCANNTIKVLLLFIFAEVVLSIIHILLGHSSIFKPFLILLYRMTFTLFPLFFGFLLLDYFRTKTMIKIMFCSLYLIMLFGLIDFFIFYFDIEILKKIYFFFVNDRVLLRNVAEVKVFIGNLPRIQSTFTEPAFLAYFLNMHLPVIYNLSFSKYKIFKNKTVNRLCKISLPILTWIVIIGMQSPIHLIFDILITLAYIVVRKRISLKKFLLILVSSIFVVSIAIFLIYLLLGTESGSPFQRLYIVFLTFTNFNILVFAEPSLATRIGTYANEIAMFLKHPFIGCGIGNFVEAFVRQISSDSPVLLTKELVAGHILGDRAVNASILYSFLAELGIFVTLIYYSFVYIFQNTLRKISKYSYGIEKDFLIGYSYFLILYIVLSFYEAFFSYFWLEFGMLIGFITVIKKRGNHACISCK